MLKKIKDMLPIDTAAVALLLGMAGLLAVVAVALSKERTEELANLNRSYALVVLSEYQGVLAPIDAIKIKNVSHQPDGALCFIQVGTDIRGCIKVGQYHLKEMNVK